MTGQGGHVSENPSVGPRLRQARLEAKLTQQSAGELVGVDPNTIARYEANRIKPSSTALFALAQIYKKPVEWFFGETIEPNEPSDPAEETGLSDNDPLLQEAELALRSMGNELTPGDIKAIRDFIRFVHTQRQQEENEPE